MPRARIFDCFTYFNEAIHLKFRLEYLSDVVDIFVVVESAYNHVGELKPFTARSVVESLPDVISRKVRIVEVNEIPTATIDVVPLQANWEREKYQRDCILRGLHDLVDDIVCISDIDEIPNASILANVHNALPQNVNGLNLCMDMFYYSADNQIFKDGQPLLWNAPKIVRPNALIRPSNLRFSSDLFPNTQPLGWHFSYMGSDEQRKIKIQSFAHQEYNNPKVLNSLNSRRKNLQDLFGRSNFSFVPYNHELLPELIFRKEIFRNFFLPELEFNDSQ